MAINFLYHTNTRPEIQINDTDDNPRLAFLESDVVSGGISTTGGNLVFETSGGTERARILSNGNFGIGTDNPGQKLEVNSGGSDSVARFTSTDARARILISDNNDISYFGTYIGTTFLGPDDTPSGNTINVLSNGNVGIGTTTPVAKLDVLGTSGGPSVFDYVYATNAGLRIHGDESAMDIVGTDSGDHASTILLRNGNEGFGLLNNPNLNALQFKSFTASADGFAIHNTGTNLSSLVDIITLEKTGNVGIGAGVNPTDLLGIHNNASGAVDAQMNFTTAATGQSTSNGFRVGWNGELANLYLFEDADMRFATNNFERMRILAGGNVGIGTDNPGSKFVVTSNTSNNTQAASVKINHSRSDANTESYGLHIDANLSGADTTTGDRTNRGIFLDLDSSADGDASNEHRIRGIQSDVRFSGFSDVVQGGYYYAESNNNTEKTAQLTGCYGYAVHDSNSTNGGVSNMYGVFGQSNVQDLGDVDNAFGGYFAVDLSSTRGNAAFGVSKGVEGKIQINKAETVDYGTMIAVSSVIDNNEGTIPNFGNQYLFKGDYQGDTGADAYGIWCEGDKHYFTGNVGIGTASPTQKLHVYGNARVTGAYYDSGNSPGAVNQVLVSTVTGTDWVDGSGSSIIGGPYLPLIGGTLTGSLTGTSATFSSNVITPNVFTENVYITSSGTTATNRIDNDGSQLYITYGGISNRALEISNSNGNATFANGILLPEVTGRAIIIGGDSTLDAADASIYLGNAPGSYGFDIQYTGTGSGNTNSLDIISTNAGAGVTALRILQDGASTFAARITASGGINGLTLANGISGDNYNITGVNVLRINDPGEGIEFAGTTTLFLNAVDDDTDSILQLRNATQLDLNSTARITNLVDPSSDQDAATKKYVDDSITGGANYLGTWDPDDSLNNGYGNPSLQASTRSDDSGDYFICSADGAAHPNGGTSEPDSWHVGDWVIWNEDLGTVGLWQKLDNTTVLSGGGTTNSIAKFTDNETIGDSLLKDTGKLTYTTSQSALMDLKGTTASGYAELDIKNDSDNSIVIGSIGSTYGGADWAGSTYLYNTGTNRKMYIKSQNNMQFFTGGNALAQIRMTILSGGNVGIGTGTPAAGLQVALGGSTIPTAGTSTASAVFGNSTSDDNYGLAVGANSSGVGYISSQRTDGTATTYNLAIQPNGGNVSIGSGAVGNPGGDKLQVDGTLRVGPYFSVSDRDFIKLVPHGSDTRIISPNERFHIENGSGHIIITPSSASGVGIGTETPEAKLDVTNGAGKFCVDSKTHNLTNAFTTCLTVNLSNHTGCYVTLTCFGDWGGHSSAAYRGEFFLQNGANSYNEPGIILRQDDNTSNGTDQIVCQLLDPTGTGNPKDFAIQIRTTATSAPTGFTGQLTYTVQGKFNSIT